MKKCIDCGASIVRAEAGDEKECLPITLEETERIIETLIAEGRVVRDDRGRLFAVELPASCN